MRRRDKNIFEPDLRGEKNNKKVDGVRNLSRDSGYLHEWNEQRNKRRNIFLKRLGVFLIVAVLAAGITVFVNMQQLRDAQRQRDEYLAQLTPAPTQVIEKATPEPVEHSDAFDHALVIYEDAVGYLLINDTNIDFPIVQGEDNFFYENRNYDRSYSEIAATYMLSECDIGSSRHLVVYGENSDIEGRFGELNKFLDYDFFHTHEYITFELIDGAKTWQVFSAHLAGTSFNYKDIEFETNTEYLAYIKMFHTMSRFERDVALTERDQVVTFVTDYQDLDLEAGYLLVHARRVN